MLMTSMSAKIYEQYGHRLVAGLKRHMPAETLMVYSEDDIAPLELAGNVQMASLHFVDAFTHFTRRHKGSAEASGRLERAGWKDKDRRDGYCYKFDALKFCRKVFAIADAARELGRGSLTWIDADSFPTRKVPDGFFDGLSGADCTFLGRPGTHSECGFLHFRLPEALPLIGSWEAFYATDRFLQEREWHDSFLFDLARAEVPSVKCHSITPPGMRGHVWVESPLGPYWDHLKGERKTLGFSPERKAKGLT